MGKFEIGQRVIHKSNGIGTVVSLSTRFGGSYDVKYDNFGGRGYSGEWELSSVHKFNIGERICDRRYGNGVILDVPHNEYMCYSVDFDNNDTEYRRISEDNMNKVDEHVLVIGDRVHAVDDDYDYFGIIATIDSDDIPYYVTDESCDDSNYFRTHEVAYAPLGKFNVGDIVHTNEAYDGRYIVGTIMSYNIGTSVVKTGGVEIRIMNMWLEVVKPKFNIGDTITSGCALTIHTITAIRPSRDGEHICYDTTFDTVCSTGTVYDDESTLYVKPRDTSTIDKLKEELELLKEVSHSRMCIGIRCDDCPFFISPYTCASNEISDILHNLSNQE